MIVATLFDLCATHELTGNGCCGCVYRMVTALWLFTGEYGGSSND
jgi:hypothetical protein